MRPLTLIEFLSLDGVMQSLGSPDEDTDGGFRHGGWSAPYASPELFEAAGRGMAETDAYLFGRRTYDKMAAFWPFQPDADPMAAHLNAMPKHVASRSTPELTWRGAELLAGPVPEAVAALKARPGGRIAVLGSGLLAQTLMEHDLVDEYELFLHPLVIGSGKRLFREAPDLRRLELVRSSATSTGVLLLSYRPVR